MNAQAPSTPNFEKRVEQFVKLRDKIAEIEKRHAEELLPYKTAKKTLEGVLLDNLNQTNQDSAATAAGTAYKTTKTTASIQDGEAFRNLVINDELWDMLDWKCNATAAKDYVEENGALPAGVTLNVTYTVGVRRKS